jgi:hypothetical protein
MLSYNKKPFPKHIASEKVFFILVLNRCFLVISPFQGENLRQLNGNYFLVTSTDLPS